MWLLKYLFIFCMFSVVGWVIELVFRSICNKKIINPGFMTGCVLPIYGFGAIILSVISNLFLNIDCDYKAFIVFSLSMLVLTTLEYLSGYIILKLFNLRLWDYSDNKLNINGFVCFKFSIVWGLMALLFYYLIFPWLNDYAFNFINNSFCLFSLGIFYGVFLIDLFVSIDLLKKIKNYSKTIKEIIILEKIKLDSIRLSTTKKFWKAIYPYIYINKFLKDKMKKK